MPERFRFLLPSWTLFKKRKGEDPESLLKRAEEQLKENGIAYPFVAKPDVGQRGAGVQLVRGPAQLSVYLVQCPVEIPVLFQEYIELPLEAGILYYRKPDEKKGRIFSATLKYFPQVVGDGIKTLRELILADPRAGIIHHKYFERHNSNLDRILEKGERFSLVFSGNHCQGAVFKDGSRLITPDLIRKIGEIADAMPEFYFGRFDVRCPGEESLRRARDFKIIEINGAGAEATHIWDAQTHLSEAYRALFEQFRVLFEIGAQNRARGFRPIGAVRLVKDLRTAHRLLKEYPPNL
jgi:hypothetical protein